MQNTYLSQLHPFTKLIFIIFTAFTCFLLVFFVGLILAFPIFGFNFENFETMFDTNKAENLNFIKYIQIVQSIGLFIVPSLISGYLFYRTPTDRFGLQMNSKPHISSLLAAAVIMVAGMPIINEMIELNALLKFPESLSWLEKQLINMETEAMALTRNFIKAETLSVFLLNFFMIAILPAFGEEFLFRGILQKNFIHWVKNPHIGIILSALFFSTIHFQFYGFLPRFAMGAFFGYLLLWSRTIWLPIMAHLVNNGIAVVSAYIFKEEFINENFNTSVRPQISLTQLIISLLVVSFLIYYIYRNENKKLAK